MAAKRLAMNAGPPLVNPPSSNAGAMQFGADLVRLPPWTFVFLLCLLLYVVHAAAAIATGRHLFLDGSWYLVRLVSDGWPLRVYNDLLTEFHYSRMAAVWATHWPAVLYLRLGGDSLAVSSWLFGAGLFGAKIVLLIVSFWILRPEHRQLVVFPLLSLFAGAIGSDPVIVGEGHFAAALLWPLLFAAGGVARGTAAVLGVVALCGALAPLTYESFLFFGPILMLGAVAGVRANDRPARANALLAGLSGFASTVTSVASVAFPRDPVNRGSFRAGLENVVRDMFAPDAEIFVPVLLAMVALLGVALALLASRTRAGGRAATVVLLPCLVFLLLFPAGYFVLRSPALAFDQSYLGRGLTWVLIPAALALLCLLLVRRASAMGAAFLAVSFTVLPALAAGQVGYQLMLTGVWARSVSVLADALGSRQGRIACEEIAASASTRGLTADQFRHAVCAWSVAPLSLLVQQPAGPQSVAFADVAYQPFDTRDGSGLPSLRFVRVPLDRLRASLDEAATIKLRHRYLFGLGGSGNRFLGSGFSHLENWGVWTDGNLAALRLCGLKSETAGGLRITLGLGAHVPSPGSTLRVRAGVGEDWSRAWVFSHGESQPLTRLIDIPAADLRSDCVDLQFLIENPQSPKALGIGGDPRKLGLALLSIEFGPP